MLTADHEVTLNPRVRAIYKLYYVCIGDDFDGLGLRSPLCTVDD